MEKYSKKKLKRKRGTKVLLVLFIIVFVVCVSALIYVLTHNNIVKENINKDAKVVSDNEAQNSPPIIINNLIVGATYNNTWVSAERYYLKSTNKNGTEVDLFSKTGKLGTYELNEVTQQAGTSAIYTKTTRANLVDEYFAVKKNAIAVVPKTISTEPTAEDVKSVKKALGIYRLLNTTVKVREVYEVTLSDNIYGKVIIANSEVGKSFGAYTTAVFVDNQGKASIIKYNYIRNLNKASDWPVYSLEFISDLNSDSVKELVLVETKEFETKYDILEYKNGKFIEVLSSVVK